MMVNQNQKQITHDVLMELYDELTLLPDSIVLRIILTRDGKYILTRVNDLGQIDRFLDLTQPLEMYKHLNKLWLQVFKEE